MSSQQLTRAYGRGCLRTLLVVPIGAALGVANVAFALFVANRADPSQEAQAMLAAAGFTTLLLGLVVVGAVLWVRRRGRKLDRAFAGRGLESSRPGPARQGWSGTAAGRRFHAWVSRGPRLELYLECDVGTRGAVRRVGPVIRAVSKRLLPEGEPVASPPKLADCQVLSHDPAWMARLMARPGVAETAAELMRPTVRTAPGLLLTPSAVGYLRAFLPLGEVTGANVERWTAQLGRIADAVEALGPSRQGLEESRLERWSRTKRSLRWNPVWIGVGCGLVACGLIAAGVLALVAILEAG